MRYTEAFDTVPLELATNRRGVRDWSEVIVLGGCEDHTWADTIIKEHIGETNNTHTSCLIGSADVVHEHSLAVVVVEKDLFVAFCPRLATHNHL